MSKVLYIETSPRKTSSRSIEVSNYFLDLYKKKYPEDIIKLLDLSKERIPEINKDVVLARYSTLRDGVYSMEEDNAWKEVKEFIDFIQSQYLCRGFPE